MKKRIFGLSAILLVAGLLWAAFYLNTLMPIVTGYPAKYLCSEVFISNRKAADVEATELNFSLVQYVKNEVNYQEKSVTSRFLWGKSKAIYREGFGSTLLRGRDENDLRKIQFPILSKVTFDQDSLLWPAGNIIPDTLTGMDKTRLAKISENLIEHHHYKGNAFAFLVLHHGIPVAEKYKPGFTSKTRFLSWSMAKSFTNALAGIMVKEGTLDIHQPTGIEAWQSDDRKNITVNNLLQMQSGLRWNEDYGNRSDVTVMLYDQIDFARFAFDQPLDHPAGSFWYYSSGTTNIVNYLMRQKLKYDSTYYRFAQTRLFNKIGMPDAVFETDASGTQVGSSYIFATARDYARFGLLYMQDGIFNGERILPEGWVTYSTTPASGSEGNYGSFFWLNKGKKFPFAPDDMFFCKGHDGQRIFIIPSRDLVVVVLGYSPASLGGMDFDLLLRDILGL